MFSAQRLLQELFHRRQFGLILLCRRSDVRGEILIHFRQFLHMRFQLHVPTAFLAQLNLGNRSLSLILQIQYTDTTGEKLVGVILCACDGGDMLYLHNGLAFVAASAVSTAVRSSSCSILLLR